MQFPIHIELHRSRLLSVLLIFFHSLALVCVLLPPWSWGIRCLLVCAIALTAWRTLRIAEILALHLSNRAGLECVVTAAGDRISATVLPGSAVFNRLVVLHLQLDGEKHTKYLPLLSDSLSEEHFRVLRLWLRWSASSPSSEFERLCSSKDA